MARWILAVGGALALVAVVVFTVGGAAPKRGARDLAARGLGALGIDADALDGVLDTTEDELEPSEEAVDAPFGDPARFSAREVGGRLFLGAPAAPTSFEALPLPDAEGEGLVATAFHFEAPIYSRTHRGRNVLGLVRRGRVLPVIDRAGGGGRCDGAWYALAEGFVCSRDGFIISPRASEREQKHATLDAPLPYEYAMVKRRGALRLYRVPESHELPALAAFREAEGPETAPPEVVDLRMVGDYFVALDAVERDDTGVWARSVRGRYVLDDDLERLPPSQLVGERIEGASRLPLAFVFAEPRTLYRWSEDGVVEVGSAAKYARFPIDREVEVDGVRYVVAESGLALRRDEVRVARAAPRDERVPPRAAWVQVNLVEQTIIAFEGDEPVYATLVASGREGYETPRGVFQVKEKHISTTMRGHDPVDGPYEVEEVPWTQYYWQSYALHGAYWHDDFGRVRSHGCTNLAPADARFLFEWTSPDLPAGWNGRRLADGTWVHVGSFE